MLSVVGSLRSWQSGGHLPPGFDAAQGLRQLFPRGLTARLSWLARYVVTVESTGQTDSAVAMQVVGADGAGNWTYHGYVQDNVPSYDGSGQVIPSSRGGILAQDLQVRLGFVFNVVPAGTRYGWKFSDTATGSIKTDNQGDPEPTGGYQEPFSAGGTDEWIRENWPQVLAGPSMSGILQFKFWDEVHGSPDDHLPEATQLKGTGSGLVSEFGGQSGPGPSGPGGIDWDIPPTGDEDVSAGD